MRSLEGGKHLAQLSKPQRTVEVGAVVLLGGKNEDQFRAVEAHMPPHGCKHRAFPSVLLRPPSCDTALSTGLSSAITQSM